MSRFDEGTGRGDGEVTAGPMPAALPSMIRVVKHGYRAEPSALGLAGHDRSGGAARRAGRHLVGPDHRRTRPPPRDADVRRAGGLAASATLMWALSVTLDRTTRRLGTG